MLPSVHKCAEQRAKMMKEQRQMHSIMKFRHHWTVSEGSLKLINHRNDCTLENARRHCARTSNHHEQIHYV